MTELDSQILADCLNEIQSGQLTIEGCLKRYPEIAGELAPLLYASVYLNQAGKITPRPAFREVARSRLLNRLPQRRPNRFPHLLPQFLQISRDAAHYSKNRIWIAAVIGVLILFVFGSGTVYASANSLPGDWLYPVKLNIEQLQYQLASNPDRLDLRLHYLAVRRSEIQLLEKDGRYQDLPGAVSQLENLSSDTVHDFGNYSNDSGSDTAQKGSTVDTALSNNLQVLTNVYEKVPDSAKPAIEHAIQMSQKDNQAVQSIIADNNGHHQDKSITTTTTPTPTIRPNEKPQRPNNTHQPDPGPNNGNTHPQNNKGPSK